MSITKVSDLDGFQARHFFGIPFGVNPGGDNGFFDPTVDGHAQFSPTGNMKGAERVAVKQRFRSRRSQRRREGLK